jgi:streptogramin lyase
MAYKLDSNIFIDYRGQTVSRLTTNGSVPLVNASIPIPLIANGMTFDADGNLWITSSNSKNGVLYKLDKSKGCNATMIPATLITPAIYDCIEPGNASNPPRYNVPIGTEDLSFDETGQLWTVSEAGCKNYTSWSYSYPLIYRIDTSKIVEP